MKTMKNMNHELQENIKEKKQQIPKIA